MVPGKYLLISLLLVLQPVLVLTKGLNLLLNGFDEDCLYLPKKKDDKLDFMVSSYPFYIRLGIRCHFGRILEKIENVKGGKR